MSEWVLISLCWLSGIVLWEGRKWYKTIQQHRKPEKGWTNTWHNNEVHCYPPNDLVDHTYEDCACSPKTIPTPLEDGTINWKVVHNALDGRE